MPPSTRDRLVELLDALAAQPGVQGALLASEDGAYLMAEMSVVVNADVLAASALSLHGAAEATLAPGGDDRPLQVIAEWGRQRIMTVSVSRGLALVVLLQVEGPLAGEVAEVEATAAAMADALAQTA